MSVFRRKKIILRNPEKEISFRRGFEPPILGLRGEVSTTELFDLVTENKRTHMYIKHTYIFLQVNCQKMTNCEQFRIKYCVKIATTLTLDTTGICCSK